MLYISGDPTFGDGGNNNPVNSVTKEGYSENNNGNSQVYTDNKVRQDIFIAGYGYNEEDGSDVQNVESLIVNGNITSGPGSIWVWAEESPLYKTLIQFAVLGAGVTVNEDTCNAFRNAQDDETTENDTGEFLYGSLEGDSSGFVYWNGISGNRKVILRKVDSSYASVAGKEFLIYKGASDKAYLPEDETKPLKSDVSGCFYVGDFPYGWYVVKEVSPEKYFYFVVVESGVYGMVDVNDADAIGGFTSKTDAQDAAKAKYNTLK
jgi:hypothetical protein